MDWPADSSIGVDVDSLPRATARRRRGSATLLFSPIPSMPVARTANVQRQVRASGKQARKGSADADWAGKGSGQGGYAR